MCSVKSNTFSYDFFSLLQKHEIEILNEADEITLDYTSLSRDMECHVSPNCLVIGYGELCDEFIELCIHNQHSYEQEKIELNITHLLPQDFVRLSGSLGNFEVVFKTASGMLEKLQTAQIVCFTPLESIRDYKGVHKASHYESAQAMLQSILKLCGDHSYVRNIIFTPKACQYHTRRKGKDGELFCHACVDICPTMGVSSDDEQMLLNLSAIDCIACGRCVSVCPTGSLQREGDTLESFTLKSRLYKGFVPLIVSRQHFSNEEQREVFITHFKALRETNTRILPFILEVPNMMNFTYFLTLLQESASPILLYDALGEHTHEDIDSINEIYGRIFGTRVVFEVSALHKDELLTIRENTAVHYAYTPNSGENTKEINAARLEYMVKLKDYGKAKVKGYGVLHIDSTACTLCMSCVEACNTGALLNHQSRFELLSKAALCTGCGYCVSSCAEQILSIESNTLSLQSESFGYVAVAKDEPFLCVECQKVFATRKSIDKIRSILAPSFQNDELKLKSLECCADCKVKIMFEGVRA